MHDIYVYTQYKILVLLGVVAYNSRQHLAYRTQNIVIVISGQNNDGNFRVASGQVSPSHPKGLFTIVQLYEMIKNLSLALDLGLFLDKGKMRPSDEII